MTGAGTTRGVPRQVYAERRSQVLEELQTSALVLHAGTLRYKNGDSDYRFRPASDFVYLVGWGEPGAVLVLRGHADDERCILFVPPRVPEAERWTGSRLGVDGAVGVVGADRAYPLDELESRLPALLDGALHVHARLGGDGELDRVLVRTLTQARARAQKAGGRPSGILDPGGLLDDRRLTKDEHEIGLIRQACALTVDGFRAALPAVRPGAGEWEIRAALEGAFLRGRASGPAFGTIVAGGSHACVLHYTANDATLPAEGLVLMDAGAEYEAYSGDVTRTVPIGAGPVGPLADLYQVVLSAKRTGLAAIRPGLTVDALEGQVRQALEEGLIALGLVGAGSDADHQERLKALIPHKASHWLGLDVHDVGSYRVHGASRSLEPGMVLTIEPGVYISEGDERAPPELRGVGIRIEDDALVTPAGVENLTAALPDDWPELLALRDGPGR